MEDNRRQEQAARQSGESVSGALAFHRRMVEISNGMSRSAEDKDTFPPDFTENLDYYLYGMPKKSP